MSYERLTVKDIRTGKCERIEDPTESAVYYINDRFGRLSLDEEVKTKRISFKEAYNRLAELEDKIESGLLVELPCKVGDEVWYIKDYGFGRKRVEKMYVVGFNFSRGNEEVVVIGSYNEMAREVYATEEAAEAKLNELGRKK